MTKKRKKTVLLPRLPRFLIGILTPWDTEKEFIQDMDEHYDTWVIPTYGSWAPRWAWAQVGKTAIVLVQDTALKFWTRTKSRAR